ncbi:LCP family protein [Kitasatospora viridis]|uniref:LytR family transcriptional attenuator n=1 Tax=Kitasatospora viridis TaxID=281105 RepID=A0A561UH02_9ACTN|nr:LCP family protein [Kitasatospora viridis]TWF98637.1 LytR family transcriptional attenuator [Kitasatospora viridis]
MAEQNGPRATGRRKSAPARRPKPLVMAGRTVACATSLAVLGTCGFSWYAYTSLTDGLTTSSALDDIKKAAPPHLDNSVNLLLIGLDSRKDMNGNDLPGQFVQDELHAGSSSDVGGYNTNTLMVMHIPANGGQVTAISIPRDDYVQTLNADGRMHKIKEAYGIAKSMYEAKNSGKGLSKPDMEKQSRDAGRKATLATVQNFLGIPIDHFAEVNLKGFYDIAQAVGPIQVCLKRATKDPAIEGQGSGADFQAGINTLNAAQALSFVRQRHNLVNPNDPSDFGDFARTHRQQAFISSVIKKLKDQGVVGDLGKMQDLFNVVKQDVVLDDQWNVLDFAQQAPNLAGGHVTAITLPIAGFETVNVGGTKEDVNKVDPGQVKKIVQQLTGHDTPADNAVDGGGSAPAPSSAPSQAPASQAPAAPNAQATGTVDVTNTSTVTGAAATESKALAGMGFTPGKVGQGTHQAKTTVLYGTGEKDAAALVAARYNVTAAPSGSVKAGHIEVVLGGDYTPSGGSGGGAAAPAAGGATAPAAPAADPNSVQQVGPPVQMGGIACVD